MIRRSYISVRDRGFLVSNLRGVYVCPDGGLVRRLWPLQIDQTRCSSMDFLSFLKSLDKALRSYVAICRLCSDDSLKQCNQPPQLPQPQSMPYIFSIVVRPRAGISPTSPSAPLPSSSFFTNPPPLPNRTPHPTLRPHHHAERPLAQMRIPPLLLPPGRRHPVLRPEGRMCGVHGAGTEGCVRAFDFEGFFLASEAGRGVVVLWRRGGTFQFHLPRRCAGRRRWRVLE